MGMTSWQPIETAPKDRCILIRLDKWYLPDLVRWRDDVPAKDVHMARPAGWFRPFGGRSHILNPTEWFDIPE